MPEPEVRWVKIDNLKVDPRYQRPPRPHIVRRYADHFNADAFGVLTVSERKPDDQIVIDGWHRVCACRLMNWNGQRVQALVHVGLTPFEEALLFDDINGHLGLTMLDRFKAQRFGQVPRAVKLAEAVESAGFVISTSAKQTNSKSIVCIAALYDIADSGGLSMVGDVLNLLREAWEFERASKQAVFVYGINTFLQAWGNDPHFDRKHFIEACGAHSAHRILIDARERRGKRLSLSMQTSLALSLQNLFEVKLKPTRRLRPYDEIARERQAETAREVIPHAQAVHAKRYAARIDTVRKFVLGKDWTTTEEVAKATGFAAATVRRVLVRLKPELRIEVKRSGKNESMFRATSHLSPHAPNP